MPASPNIKACSSDVFDCKSKSPIVSPAALPSTSNASDGSSKSLQVIDLEAGDPEDPLNWPPWLKWVIVGNLTLITASVQLATVIAAPVAPQVEHDLHAENALDATLLVTIWELGEVVGPLLYGSLCERIGRLSVLHATNVLFVVFAVGCALSRNIGTLLAIRFLSGASVAAISIGNGVIADLFKQDERGLALSLMMVASQAGPAAGPIVGSYLGQAAGWRWVFWLTAITTGATSISFAVSYRETYRVTILERRVCKLRRSTGDDQLCSKYEHEQGALGTGTSRFMKAVFRPIYLLFNSWALAGVTAFVSISLGLWYIALTTISSVFQDIYGFSEGETGLTYLGMFIGMMIGCIFFNLVNNRQVKRTKLESQDNDKPRSAPFPEKQLTPSIAASLVIAAGFMLFGWTAQYRVQWMAPMIGTGLVGFGYFLVTVCVRSYIIAFSGIWATSACAIMLSVRNLAAALLPLVGPPLFGRIGLGWGSTLLAFVSVGLTPMPLLLMEFGERLRQRSDLKVLD